VTLLRLRGLRNSSAILATLIVLTDIDTDTVSKANVKQTCRRTDTTDCITSAANSVGRLIIY